MKKVLGLAIVLVHCLTAAVAFAQAADNRELFLKLRTQHSDVWCWGATIAMVVEYTKGFSVYDCEVLLEYDLSKGGRGLCCLSAPECKRPGQLGEMAEIMGQIFKISGRYKSGVASFEEVTKQIDQDKPLILFLVGRDMGHVVVVSGYEKNGESLILLDPASGRTVVPYKKLAGAGANAGPWRYTFFIDSPRSTFPLCERQGASDPKHPEVQSRIICK